MASSNSCYVGVDLGGTTIKFALIDNDGAVLHSSRCKTEADEGHERVLERMVAGALEIVAKATDDQIIRAVGVAVPGVLDMDRGYTIFLPNLPGDWPDVPVGPVISAAIGLPVFLINGVRAFTVAGLEIGAAKGVETALCYAIGTGIGGGIVAHGRVNMGLGGAGGELGHMVVNPSGPLCGCGNRGCAEAYAAGPAIIGEANRLIVMGETTAMREMIGDDLNKMTPEIVERAAGEGDPIARQVLDYAGFHMGLAVANAIAALAPNVVVLGGGVLKPHGYFWEQIEASARAHCHVTEIDKIEFRPARLGYEAGVVGAALWAKTAYEARHDEH
jgi:glucokinase